MKNKKIILLLSVSLILVLALSGCGTSMTSSIEDGMPMWSTAETDSVSNGISSGGFSNYKSTNDSSYESVSDSYYEETAEIEVEKPTENTETTNGIGTNESNESMLAQEKLVYTSKLSLESKEYDNAVKFIHSKIEEVNGIIEEETQNSLSYYGDGYRSARAYFLVRIPQQNYSKFLTDVQEGSKDISVVNVSRSVDNFTTIYSDIETEIKSLQTMRERLFTYLENAKNVEEMLELEERIARNQYEIDTLVNSRNKIDRDVAYSTVHINLSEVRDYTEQPKPKDNFLTRLWGYITGSVNNFLNSAEDLLEFVIYALPTLIIWAIIIIVIIKVIKKSKLKKGKKSKNLTPKPINSEEITEKIDENNIDEIEEK